MNYHQTRGTAGSSDNMNVAVRKYNLIGSSVKFSSNFTGSTSGKFSGELDKGKYFLRFETGSAYAKFDISGSVN